MMKARLMRQWMQGGPTLATLGVLCAVSCAGEVMVGEVDEGAGGDDGSDSAAVDGCTSCGGGSVDVDCTAHDERLLSDYHRWRAAENEFGELAGSHWVGFVSPGSVSVERSLDLVITADHEATLQVGTPTAPMAGGGYLENDGSALPEGARYEIHGAGFDEEELLIPVPLYAPYAEWCPLQVPYPRPDTDCGAELVPGAVSCTGEVCTTDGRTVSRSYVLTTGINPCACTLSECVTRVEWPVWEPGETFADHRHTFRVEALVLTYDPEEDTLSGYLDASLAEEVEFTRAE